MDQISIRGLRIFAHHGVFEEETENGQDFYLDAVLSVPCRKAGKSDCLDDSVDYGAVCHFMKEEFTRENYRLIEAAAEHLAEAVLHRFPLVEHIRLSVRKPHAPIGLPFEDVSVTIERGWHVAYLSIGSNMGDREAMIREGIRRLGSHPGILVVRQSGLIETAPYGGVVQDDFLNGALELRTLLSPQELLDAIHETEEKAGRVRDVRWGPRTLDIDIVFYDRLVYEDENLILPHVDMENRLFVLEPLMELCPNLRHPLRHETVSQMLERLRAAGGMARIDGKE